MYMYGLDVHALIEGTKSRYSPPPAFFFKTKKNNRRRRGLERRFWQRRLPSVALLLRKVFFSSLVRGAREGTRDVVDFGENKTFRTGPWIGS